MELTDVPESSRRIAGVFDRAAATYDAVGIPWFQPIADRLVEEVSPQPGERVLDIGCGRGAALFPLAAAVTPSGHVTGIDLSTGMVAATQADVDARGLTNVELGVMDASAPSLPEESFDLVTASLVLFFLPEPAAALVRWRRLLRAGGRLGISTFGPADPHWVELDNVFRPYLPPQMLDARTSGKQGPFETDAGVEELLTSAGFVSPRTVGFHLPVLFHDVEDWYRWSWSHGQRAMWEAVGAEHHDAVRAEAFALLDTFRRPDGAIPLGQQVRLTLATT